MGERERAERPLEDLGNATEASAAWPASWLLGYRAAVNDLVEETGRQRNPADPLAVEGLVAKRLGQPEFADVLSRLDGGIDVAADRLIA